MKREGEKYLPKLTDQSAEDYRAMVLRADFFAATKRTRDALVGMLLRKPPQFDLQEDNRLEELSMDVDLEGSSLRNYARKVTEVAVSTGRGVSVIDYSAEEKRPVLCFYPATSIINWATRRVKDRNVLSMLIVKESVESSEDVKITKVERYRELRLDDDDNVVWREWETVSGDGRSVGGDANPGPDKSGQSGGSKATGYVETAWQEMKRKGKPLKRIPAVFHNAAHLGPDVGEAPLIDIADLNLSHYRSSADLENGRHIAGLPTPWATGIDDGADKLHLGSSYAWTATNPQARFGFLEFTGQGLGVLENALKDKERQMAILGARLLFDHKKEAEAFDTVALRAASETAALANLAGYLSASLTSVLQWFAWWESTLESPNDHEVSVLVNDDFIDTPMDPQTLAGLVTAFQADAISFETFFFQLQKGEVYPDNWDLDREVGAIGQRPPVTKPVVPDVKPDDDDDDDDDPDA